MDSKIHTYRSKNIHNTQSVHESLCACVFVKMASPLEALKAKSRKRREILALQLGVDDADGLTKALASQEERAEARDVLPPQKIPRLAPDRAVVSSESDVGIRGNEVAKGPDGEQHAQATRVRRRSSEDVELSEKVYTDSSAFLKGYVYFNISHI